MTPKLTGATGEQLSLKRVGLWEKMIRNSTNRFRKEQVTKYLFYPYDENRE